MAVRSQEEARAEFMGPLQRAVSCVSKAVVVCGHADQHALPFWSFAERYVPLRGQSRLEFSILHSYRFRERGDEPGYWEVNSAGYAYQVRERGGSDLIRFEWHPIGHQVRYPHLHVHGQAGLVRIDAKHHVPTGRVSLEAGMRFLIDELRVDPLRTDWQQVLDEGERQFRERRSW